MPKRTSKAGSELFIVDKSDVDWKVLRYLHNWCQISRAIDIATGYFEIGALLGLTDEWQKVDQIHILMGDRLDASLEAEKTKNDFLAGVPAVVEAIRSGKFLCHVCKSSSARPASTLARPVRRVPSSAGRTGAGDGTRARLDAWDP